MSTCRILGGVALVVALSAVACGDVTVYEDDRPGWDTAVAGADTVTIDWDDVDVGDGSSVLIAADRYALLPGHPLLSAAPSPSDLYVHNPSGSSCFDFHPPVSEENVFGLGPECAGGVLGWNGVLTVTFDVEVMGFGAYFLDVETQYACTGVEVDGELYAFASQPPGSGTQVFLGMVSDAPFTTAAIHFASCAAEDGIGIDDLVYALDPAATVTVYEADKPGWDAAVGGLGKVTIDWDDVDVDEGSSVLIEANHYVTLPGQPMLSAGPSPSDLYVHNPSGSSCFDFHPPVSEENVFGLAPECAGGVLGWNGVLTVTFDAEVMGFGAYFLDVETQYACTGVEVHGELSPFTTEPSGSGTQVFLGVVSGIPFTTAAIQFASCAEEDGIGIDDLVYALALGDLNCDGAVNFFDIDPFVLAVTQESVYQGQYPDCDINQADCNGDGLVDFFDIDGFVELISG